MADKEEKVSGLKNLIVSVTGKVRDLKTNIRGGLGAIKSDELETMYVGLKDRIEELVAECKGAELTEEALNELETKLVDIEKDADKLMNHINKRMNKVDNKARDVRENSNNENMVSKEEREITAEQRDLNGLRQEAKTDLASEFAGIREGLSEARETLKDQKREERREDTANRGRVKIGEKEEDGLEEEGPEME